MKAASERAPNDPCVPSIGVGLGGACLLPAGGASLALLVVARTLSARVNPLVFVEVSKLLSNTAVIGAEKAQRLMALVLSVEASASSTKGAATSHDVRGRGPQFRWASLASSA